MSRELPNSNFNSIEELDEVACNTSKIISELDKLLQNRGITFREWQVLNIIVIRSHPTPSFTGKQLNISNSAISKILEILEFKGLIERRYQRSDRRTIRLWYSDKGHEKWLIGKRVAHQLMQNTELKGSEPFYKSRCG